MKVLICGSREWGRKAPIETFLAGMIKDLDEDELLEVVHGDATGADRIAGQWAEKNLFGVNLPYPADWDSYGKAAGPIRNQEMLDDNIDIRVVIGFSDNIEGSGTEDMLRRADKAGIPTFLFQRFRSE